MRRVDYRTAVYGFLIAFFWLVLGAILLVALPEVFREFQAYRLLAFGLILMVLMVVRPQGMLSGDRGGAPEPEPEAPTLARPEHPR